MKKKYLVSASFICVFVLISFFIQSTKSYSQSDNKIYLPIIFNNFTTNSHFYAQVQKSGTFYGVWATIETANPAIREPFFSYASINIIGNYGQWIETGWIKSSTSGCIPKFSWAIQPGYANIISSPLPEVGVSYQYLIEKISSGYWRLNIIRTDGLVIFTTYISNPGMDHGVALQAVGEVDSTTKKNDMGVSGILSLKWKNSYSQWQDWNGYIFGVVDYPPYLIWGIPPDQNNNVQISGNNGNPIPPGAPCP